MQAEQKARDDVIVATLHHHSNRNERFLLPQLTFDPYKSFDKFINQQKTTIKV